MFALACSTPSDRLIKPHMGIWWEADAQPVSGALAVQLALAVDVAPEREKGINARADVLINLVDHT